MGNFCSAGGSNVTIQSGSAITSNHAPSETSEEEKGVEKMSVRTNVDDNGDGSYTLKWTSPHSGTFPVRVMINGQHVHGSPATLLITSGPPEVSKCTIDGEGLRSATAGLPAVLSVLAKDRYENVAQHNDLVAFGLLLIPTSEQKADAQAMKELIKVRTPPLLASNSTVAEAHGRLPQPHLLPSISPATLSHPPSIPPLMHR